MRILQEKLTPDSQIFKAVLVFLLAFIILAIVWTQVKDSYSYAITLASSKLLSEIKDAELEGIGRKGDAFDIALKFSRGGKDFSLAVSLPGDVSRYYAFTVPLTVSLLASLSFFIRRRWRAYIEALLILLMFHLLYVFSVEATIVTEQLMLKGIESMNVTRFSVYQYAWKANEFAVMSIGPFLIAVYVFLRFRK